MVHGDIESRGRNPSSPKDTGNFSTGVYYETSTERHWTSWLVPMFVVANVAVFLVVMYINDCPKKGQCVARFLGRFSFQPINENPLLGPSSATLTKLGALEWDKVVHRHQGWRLITLRIGVIYLLSGFGGSILSSLFIQNNISVGASGALFGLLGAMLSELLTNWTIYSNKLAALVTLIMIVAINLAVGILPHVDNFAHIGGFLSGFLLGFILLIRPQFGWIDRNNLPSSYAGRINSKHLPYQYVLWVIALVLLIVGYTVSLVMLFRGENGNKHCHWCHYLSCVPTSSWSCGN
ncbi:hypothetical protein AMTR_s00069p00097470 [Amborella trichopoda]|uniref:RHOMBOID-like protein n=1 Tax=Amborella trichopoda TaxID=13333 RepID=U5DFY4_AMBTC|nr:hypothetical protein AMTR_s00069p00097470 [Amborella trichopoda]